MMTPEKKRTLERYKQLATKYNKQYVTLTACDSKENTTFEVNLNKEEMGHVYRLLEEGLDPLSHIGAEPSISPIIPTGHFMVAQKYAEDNNYILCEHKGDIVYVNTLDEVVCDNKLNDETEHKLDLLFKSYKVVSPREAMQLILNEANVLHIGMIDKDNNLIKATNMLDESLARCKKLENSIVDHFIANIPKPNSSNE